MIKQSTPTQAVSRRRKLQDRRGNYYRRRRVYEPFFFSNFLLEVMLMVLQL